MMKELWLILQQQSLFVYVIAGVCAIGVIGKLLVRGKIRSLIRASENMGSTTQRQLRTMRNHYENSLNMDLQVHNMQAFVDKHLLKLRFCGLPIRIWDSMTMEAALLTVATGGIGIVNAIHKGYGETVVFSILFAMILSCACLLSVENIFRIENSYDLLQANIEDYLENNLKNRLGRPLVSRQSRSRQQIAASMEKPEEPLSSGRANPRPEESVQEMTKSCDSEHSAMGVSERELSERETDEQREISEREIAAGQEAEVVAQVLRNFFSS